MLRHATTSPIDPEFSSDTHRMVVRQTPEQPKSGMRKKIRIFDLFIDVSGEPIGEWFEIAVTANYWNAVNTPKNAWVALPIIYKANKVVFELLLPDNKPAKSWERREGSRDSKETELVSDGAISFNEERTNIVWNIEGSPKDWVYQYKWEW